MQLEWKRAEKPSEFGREWRAWGVSVPYRILETLGYFCIEQFGTGRDATRLQPSTGAGIDLAMSIAQAWEDEHQALLDGIS